MEYHIEKFVPQKFYELRNFHYLMGGVSLAALLVFFLLICLCLMISKKRKAERELQRTTPVQLECNMMPKKE